jgi:hypothetical protein
MRYAVRALRRSPGFTLTAVATLAIGIGVNAAVFTVTNAALFKGFRLVERNDRILYIDTRERGRGCCVSYPDFEAWRAQAASFEDIGTVADPRMTLSDDSGFPEGLTLIQSDSLGVKTPSLCPCRLISWRHVDAAGKGVGKGRLAAAR